MTACSGPKRSRLSRRAGIRRKCCRGRSPIRRSQFLVATEGNGVVGHALGRADAGGEIVLSRLYVLPARQSEGIGRRLLHALLDTFPGAVAMSAAVHAGNEAALRFYMAAGFELGEHFEEDGIPHRRVRLRLAGGQFCPGKT
jgi:ribosomal protein S18 acetylase RimI-like enzyme